MKKFLNKNKTTLTLFGAGVSSLVASYLFTCGAHSAPANSIIEAFYGIPAISLCLFGVGFLIASVFNMIIKNHERNRSYYIGD